MFKDKLKKAFDNSGYTQQQLADELGLTQAAISMWLSGKREPSVFYLRKLAKLFKVSMNWFYEED
jgi:transcriptional regulator with XRE-family HTH domain